MLGFAVLPVSRVWLLWRLVEFGCSGSWFGLAVLAIVYVWFGLIPVDDLTGLPDSHLSGQTHDGSFPYNELPNLRTFHLSHQQRWAVRKFVPQIANPQLCLFTKFC
jgi:hypothetical protein